MSLTKIEVGTDIKSPFVRAIEIRKSYICINCDCVIHGDDMVHGKTGNSCPGCGSAQLFPMTNWFKEASA